jgi:Ser-tRNA(Ala) deacylase AlaX
MTGLVYLRDAYLQEFDATVTAGDGTRVALDRWGPTPRHRYPRRRVRR